MLEIDTLESDLGLTYLPSPHPKLNLIEIGRFQMGIYGIQSAKWETQPPSTWPFAVPITQMQIHSLDYESLDLWPKGKFVRKIKYQFELLETALQSTRLGLSVIHCPEFVAKLHNRTTSSQAQLSLLPYPTEVKARKPVKIYLVSRKGEPLPNRLEGKLSKFIRSLTRAQ